MARILLASTAGDPDEKKRHLSLLTRSLGKDSHTRERSGYRKINVRTAMKWDTGLKIAPKSIDIRIMTQDATPAMCWLQNR